MKWENKGHEFDELLQTVLDPTKSYYIWGGGTFGIAFFERFHHLLKIVGFVDRNEEKCGTVLLGLKVISPKEFAEKRTNEVVLVSTGLTKSAYQSLDDMGLVRYRDYYHIDEAASIYEFVNNNRLFFNDVDIQITQKCSLRCEYCNAFIPLLKEKTDTSLSDIIKSLECYFTWVDEVNILSLSGGDAMMHSSFESVLEWIGDHYYPQRINHIELYCNAVIVPNDRILDLMRKYNVIYRFTDYHGRAGAQRIEEVKRLLMDNNIQFDHADLESWYDSGYPQETNGILGDDNLIHFCTLCDKKSCHGLWGTRLLGCSICKNAEDIGYCETLDTDYFDLENFCPEKRIELLEYYMGFSEKGYYNYCKKCNGGMNVNTHAILPGEQL